MRYTLLLFFGLSLGHLSAQSSLYLSVGPEIKFRSVIDAKEITKLDPKIPAGDNIADSDYIGVNTTLPMVVGLLIPLTNEQSNRPRAAESFLQVGLGFSSGNLVGSSSFSSEKVRDTHFIHNAFWQVDSLSKFRNRIDVQSDFIRLDVGAFVRAYPKRRASTCLGIGLIGGYSFSSQTEVTTTKYTHVQHHYVSGDPTNGTMDFSKTTIIEKSLQSPGIWALSLYTSMRIEFALRKPELSLRNSDLFFLEFRPQTMLESYGSRGFNFSSASIQLLMGFSISL